MSPQFKPTASELLKGVGVGLILGIAIGLLFESLPLGIFLGLLVGLAISKPVFGQKQQ